MKEEGEEEKQNKPGENQAESAEPVGDEPGTSAGSGRFYDCIFCKRGFTTAQALGGHMNIHRKDRARLRPVGPSSPGPRRREEAHHPYSRPLTAVSKQQVDPSYVVYFPASPSESSRRSTELQLGLGGSGPEEKGKKVFEEDLDLELRLGHSKSHHEQESSSD